MLHFERDIDKLEDVLSDHHQERLKSMCSKEKSLKKVGTLGGLLKR